MSKYLLTFPKLRDYETAICPITGTSIFIKVPSIPSIVWTYTSPLAIPSNALAIAKLTASQIDQLEPQILAGAILSLIHHNSLAEDKLSAVERNCLLCECKKETLRKFLLLFTNNSVTRIGRFPHFSFSSLITTSAAVHCSETINSSILAYVELCDMPRFIQQQESTVHVEVKKIRTHGEKKDKQVSSQTRQAIKTHTDILNRSGLLPTKIIGILYVVGQRNNLYTMDATVRIKLASKLEELNHSSAAILKEILEEASTSQTDIAQHFLPPVRKSLKDILAEKMAKPTSESSPTTLTSIPSIPSNEILVAGKTELPDFEEEEQEETYNLVDELLEAAAELELESSQLSGLGSAYLPNSTTSFPSLNGEDDEF